MTEGPVEKDIDLSTGLHMHYFEWQGSGPTLVFLHPSSGYGRMWEFTASHLSPDFHMYALEQRGHGDSSKPDGGYTGEEYAEDLRAFMEAREIGQAILIGHSLGGRVAQIFAATYPRLTQAVVLAAGPHYESFFQVAPIVDSVLQNAERMRSAPREFDTEEEVVRYNQERYPALSGEAISHRVQYNFRRLPDGKYGPKYDPLRVAQGLAHIPDDLTRYARTVTCPVAFVIGNRSTQITRPEAEKVAVCYQETKVNIYEVEAGNVLQVENPGALAQSIREFVDLHSLN
jgi:pimeloyl-ACP methyl ester carboxylesterase